MLDNRTPNKNYYIDVLLPLPIPKTFCYSVSDENGKRLEIGVRVAVRLGDWKLYSGIVIAIHEVNPIKFIPRDITGAIDDKPTVDQNQLKLWEWIASYYLCTLGEVMRAALPSGLKLEGETKLIPGPRIAEIIKQAPASILAVPSLPALPAAPDAAAQPTLPELFSEYDEFDKRVIRYVSKRVSTLNEVVGSNTRSSAVSRIKQLIDNGTLAVKEEVGSAYRVKNKAFIRLHPDIRDEKQLADILSSLSKAPKQEQLLLAYLGTSEEFDCEDPPEVPKDELLKEHELDHSAMKACEKKGILITVMRQMSRIQSKATVKKKLPDLTAEQQTAKEEIQAFFGQKPVLLRGVTSSGKTEIYIHLIDEQLRQGRQCLYLLPEIALTTQIIERLRSVFGSKVGVYHSRFSDAERVEMYNNLIERKYSDDKAYVVLGVRSAIFLPFTDLGLIIVDEEHEMSYKQYEPAPRYNARDSAVMLASIHGADILLGSATPAIESYSNAKSGKYGLVELTKRYGAAQLPQVEVIDMVKARKSKQVVSHFSQSMVEAIRNALERREQVILFQNRRGFSPFVECSECGHIPRCRFCDVSLTYHKQQNLLTCHYCGMLSAMPQQCPECGGKMKAQGFGTEKIEDDLALLLPEARVARLDLDAAKAKNAYERILHEFEAGEVDILVGTQMITKGLDFANVSLVGIMNADNMLGFVDFRAYERAFQLMSQVAGRAGRKDIPGRVLIQTSMPNNPIIRQVVEHDYLGFFASQIEERRQFNYPPYSRLITLTLKHVKKETLLFATSAISPMIRSALSAKISGPQPPPIGRIRNKHLMCFRIKLNRDADLQANKQLLQDCCDSFLKMKSNRYASVQVVIDIDPV
ncbi:MAG: primosomal protein N' [Prevotellaceae bacterium]|jgi:primosomal protein N' (replication factor Y)|nr:primosomal protein N' [Prevotellaceae bacterium]